jgi:transglutaminase-like putative cysteine protease
LPAEARASEYENAGYRLRRLGSAFEVEVDLLPLDSSAPFVVPRGAGDDQIERLARQLVRGSRDQYEAVSRLLGWVARHVRYRLDRDAPQDARSVLARGDAYCTGVARLSVALLTAAGLEAREVAGFVVDDPSGGTEGEPGDPVASGYHRWIEVRYPDRGWVFSDPLRYHHFVLDLAPEATAGAGRSLARERRVEIADVYSPAPSPILARRNRSRQLASTLRVMVEPATSSSGTSRLSGDGSVWTQPLVDGEATFVGLHAGEYELEITLAGGETVARKLRLASPVRSVLSVSAPHARERSDADLETGGLGSPALARRAGGAPR